MKNSAFVICNEYIQPGEKANLALQMPDLYSCAPLYMPIKVIHSKVAGPTLLIFSTINGNEMNGLEIVNRLIKSISADDICGTIIAVPVLNIYGLTHYPKSMPSGNHNLADCFPGQLDGKYGERIAYIFTNELIKKADYCIELQSGSLNHNILPQVYCNFEDPKVKRLAKHFQVPVVTNVSTNKNKLRQTMESLGIPLIVYQAGEAMRFDENAIKIGIEGTKNIMRAIEMSSDEPHKQINPVFSQDEEWITAPKGGILHVEVELGQVISQNDKIGTISDPFASDHEETLKATKDGIVVGINTTPLIHEGLSIFKIASFVDYDKAENAIGSWEQRQQEQEQQETI
ncbi:MAG: succinylglutamate desuccinylase/aspartoacylase family protein [Candidatus Berkiella sp.]